MLDIHKNIYKKLDGFLSINKIPNIIFHGPCGSGKQKILFDFINNIYNNNKDHIKDYVLYVNCAHAKGIKFIRDDLKFFAKINIKSSENKFKSVILRNADKLTIDAQSALRRSIELFTHTTRFFIVVENKYKLLKPILSRFCEVYIPLPKISTKTCSLYKYNNEKTINSKSINNVKSNWLKKTIDDFIRKGAYTNITILDLSVKLYEKGYSCLDIISYIENEVNEEDIYRYELIFFFNKIKSEFRDDKMLMFILLNFFFIRSYDKLENITII